MNTLPNTLQARLDLSSKSEKLTNQLYKELAIENGTDEFSKEIDNLLNNML